MLKVDTYSVKGTKLNKTLSVPDVTENLSLLAQAVHVYRDRTHSGSSKTKTRAEINRTTKKVYKQKGTGGARHGSRRAPIYVGGGIAHGRKLETKTLSLSQKMRKKALDVALYLKAKNKELVAVEGLGSIKKTKEGQTMLTKLNLSGKKVIVLADKNMASAKALTNLANTKVTLIKNLNAYEVVTAGKLIMDADIWAGSEKSAKPEKEVKATTKEVKPKTKAKVKETKKK